MPQPYTALNLLAPDGILRVEFAKILNADQYVEMLRVTQDSKSLQELGDGLRSLGDVWGIPVVTEVVSRKRLGAGDSQ